mmetsp:Transcript_23422/g.92834  ORF Transcript_23422/g.92834 Transcript_23422/m.92834 type:complete len:236 (-) Transcript_23422:481-1188(-)
MSSAPSSLECHSSGQASAFETVSRRADHASKGEAPTIELVLWAALVEEVLPAEGLDGRVLGAHGRGDVGDARLWDDARLCRRFSAREGCLEGRVVEDAPRVADGPQRRVERVAAEDGAEGLAPHVLVEPRRQHVDEPRAPVEGDDLVGPPSRNERRVGAVGREDRHGRRGGRRAVGQGDAQKRPHAAPFGRRGGRSGGGATRSARGRGEVRDGDVDRVPERQPHVHQERRLRRRR